MKRNFFAAAILLAALPANASPLADQIDAVDDAQTQQQHGEEQQQRLATAAAEKRRAIAAAAQRERQAAVMADKKRNQAYEDEMRMLELQATKARVARANDYIDQELKAKSAETDVVQSQADAARNISSGAKSLMEQKGAAEVKHESGLFK